MQNYERAFDKVTGGIEKGAGCLEKIQAGCLWAVLHLVWMGLLAWAVFLAYQSWHFTQSGVAATGTVVENRAIDDADGTTYKPVVEFEIDGQVYRFEGGNSSSPPAYRVGQSVRVLYDPADPSQAQINSIWERWLAPFLMGSAAVLMALIVTGIMVFRIITRRSLVIETD